MLGSGAAVTAGDLLTVEELQHLRRLSPLRSAWLIAHAWGVIAAAAALYILWPSALTVAVAVVVIGARQLGLAVLVHEAAHRRLFHGLRANTVIATWCCAAPVWADLPRYRRRHHLHHRHTLAPEDPDLPLARSIPESPGALALALLADLSGFTAARRVATWWSRHREDSGANGAGAAGSADHDVAAPSWRTHAAVIGRMARVARAQRAALIANAALFAALAAFGRWDLYVLLWLLPRVTWFELAARVRDIAEHGMLAPSDDPFRNTRSISAGPLARAVLAPYWVNYHLEHHLLVFVPCWKLREVRALLVAKGLGDRLEMASSYFDVMRRAATRPHGDQRPLAASSG